MLSRFISAQNQAIADMKKLRKKMDRKKPSLSLSTFVALALHGERVKRVGVTRPMSSEPQVRSAHGRP